MPIRRRFFELSALCCEYDSACFADLSFRASKNTELKGGAREIEMKNSVRKLGLQAEIVILLAKLIPLLPKPASISRWKVATLQIPFQGHSNHHYLRARSQF